MTYTTIEVDVPNDIAAALAELASRCNHCGAIGDGFATHSTTFTTAKLLAMLAEDASQIVSQPDSWQSANMVRVLASHGYMLNKRQT